MPVEEKPFWFNFMLRNIYVKALFDVYTFIKLMFSTPFLINSFINVHLIEALSGLCFIFIGETVIGETVIFILIGEIYSTYA